MNGKFFYELACRDACNGYMVTHYGEEPVIKDGKSVARYFDAGKVIDIMLNSMEDDVRDYFFSALNVVAKEAWESGVKVIG